MKMKGFVIGLIIFLFGVSLLLKFARAAERIEPGRLAWLEQTLIAHRGLHDEKIPENSLPAFQAAVHKGYSIELDVAMTKDGKLVVYHDKKLRRGMGIDAYLHDLTYDELTKYKLFGSAETIPLFADVLTAVAGQVPLLIEIKNEGKVGEMERLLYQELQGYEGQYAIQSFNPFTLQWFRKNAPEVIRGQLAGSFVVSDYEVVWAGTTRLPWYKRILLKNLLLNFVSRPHFIAYEAKNISAARFRSLRQLGVPLLGWTIKTKAEYDEANVQFNNLIVEGSFD